MVRWGSSNDRPGVLRLVAVVIVTVFFTASAASPPDARRRGIAGQPAPALGVSTWFNLPTGKKRIELSDLKGKVIVLFFFQSW